MPGSIANPSELTHAAAQIGTAGTGESVLNSTWTYASVIHKIMECMAVCGKAKFEGGRLIAS